MIIELEKLDHVVLLKEEKCILMLIIDPADIWNNQSGKGLKKLFKSNLKREMDVKHHTYLCKKVENYVNYINNNGLINNFLDIRDSIDEYHYEIRIITQFEPEKWYFDTIEQLNNNTKEKINKNVIITHELNIGKQ